MEPTKKQAVFYEGGEDMTGSEKLRSVVVSEYRTFDIEFGTGINKIEAHVFKTGRWPTQMEIEAVIDSLADAAFDFSVVEFRTNPFSEAAVYGNFEPRHVNCAAIVCWCDFTDV